MEVQQRERKKLEVRSPGAVELISLMDAASEIWARPLRRGPLAAKKEMAALLGRYLGPTRRRRPAAGPR